MIGFRTGLLLAVALAVGSVACAPPEPISRSGKVSKGASKADADDADEIEEDDDSDSDGPKEVGNTTSALTASTVTAAPSIEMSFAASAKQSFNGKSIGRVCSHTGADLTQATLIDATSLSFVRATNPSEVLVTVTGNDFVKLRDSILTTGKISVEIDPAKMPAEGEDYEYAIVAGGDSRFGSPAACGLGSLKPTDEERDVELFPSNRATLFGKELRFRDGPGCAILGFFEAFWNAEKKVAYARPTSQLLISAWEEDKGNGFTLNPSRKGCDWKDSPLVLDLGARGVSLSTQMTNVFDVDGDGTVDDSPWVSSNDTPFLVRDANGNGVVDGVGELFGNRTRGTNGLMDSENGFEALAQYDTNKDGVIDAKDEVWSSLGLWFDKNHDGKTDPGELTSPESRGVRSVSVGYVAVDERLLAGGKVQGAVRQRGGATMDDGRVIPVVDVWFYRH